MMPGVPPYLWAALVGGAVGAGLRYWVGHAAVERWPEHPWAATFVVNVVGSAVLGVLAGVLVGRPGLVSRGVEVGVMVGVLGALTTYSTFAADAVKLVHGGKAGLAAGYVLGTTVVALGVAGLGFWVVLRVLGAGGQVGSAGG